MKQLAAAILLFIGVVVPVIAAEPAAVTPAQADAWLAVTPGAQVLDVRTKEEFATGHHLRSKDAMGLLKAGTITSVRIELVLGPGRMDRKSIELNGDNRIKFNRASHADEVYQYLRYWTLMGQSNLAEESAA